MSDAPAIAHTKKIGLALSGGGVRAAAFHLGVMKRLADDWLLESVTDLSTVSGGSLVTAAVVSRAGMRWPTSAEFTEKVFPELRHLMSTTDLFGIGAVGLGGLLEFNLRLLRERAAVLAVLLERRWGVTGRLADLPDAPHWTINTTCLETGKNWRFAKHEMGDWKFGKHYAPDVPLSVAVAASAAVPYALGSLRFAIPSDGWWETDPATNKPLRKKRPSYETVHLWDGAAYENLGLESFHKLGRGLSRSDFLICSDASGPLRPGAACRARGRSPGIAPAVRDRQRPDQVAPQSHAHRRPGFRRRAGRPGADGQFRAGSGREVRDEQAGRILRRRPGRP